MPSPILANTCGVSVNGAMPTQVRALAAHLREGAGLVAVVQRHEVAADAGGGEAAFRQPGRRAVRTAGAERRDAAQQARRPIGHARRRRVLDVQAAVAREAAPVPSATLSGDSSISGGQQWRAGRVGLAADRRAFVGRQVIQRVADLRFDQAALFLDHEDRALAASEVAQPLGFQRPRHRDLVKRDQRMPIKPKHAQRTQRVLMRAADGDNADRCIVAARYAPIEPIGACPGQRGRQSFIDDAAFQFGAVGWEDQRRVDSSGHAAAARSPASTNARAEGIDQRGSLLGRLRGGLQRDPQAAVARQRNASEAEIDDVLQPTPDSAPE